MSGIASIVGLVGLTPIFVLALVRIAAMMLYTPILGSARIPKRVRVLLAVALTLGVVPGITAPAHLPQTGWEAAVAIGGEMIFGLAMGMAVSAAFIAAQWAGEVIGQQMGLNIGEIFDPQFGGSSSAVGDLYFMLTMVVFLLIGGHIALVKGVEASFRYLPLGGVGMSQGLMALLVMLMQSITVITLRMAAPVLVTMLVVDLAMGLVGKAMPQFNIMATGMTLRSIVAMVVLIIGVSLSSDVIRGTIVQSLRSADLAWKNMGGIGLAGGAGH